MPSRTWLITGVSSGFGRELTEQIVGDDPRSLNALRVLDEVTTP